MEKLRITNARKIRTNKLQNEIRQCSKFLENETGMNRCEAETFVARVLSLGIAIQEKRDSEKVSAH